MSGRREGRTRQIQLFVRQERNGWKETKEKGKLVKKKIHVLIFQRTKVSGVKINVPNMGKFVLMNYFRT